MRAFFPQEVQLVHSTKSVNCFEDKLCGRTDSLPVGVIDSFCVGLDGFKVYGYDGEGVGYLVKMDDGAIEIRVVDGFVVGFFVFEEMDGPKEKTKVGRFVFFTEGIFDKIEFEGEPEKGLLAGGGFGADVVDDTAKYLSSGLSLRFSH